MGVENKLLCLKEQKCFLVYFFPYSTEGPCWSQSGGCGGRCEEPVTHPLAALQLGLNASLKGRGGKCGGGEHHFNFVSTSQTSIWDERAQPCPAAPPSLVVAVFCVCYPAREAAGTVDGNESAPVLY